MTQPPSARSERGVVDVLRHAQRLIHASGDPEAARVIRELDSMTSALAVLPDLYAQMAKRYDVLFPEARRGPAFSS